MTRIANLARAIACASVLAAAPALAQSGMKMEHGHDASHENTLHVAHGWARATPGMVKTGAAYITLHNAGKTDDKLVAAETPVAGRAEIHTHIMDGTVMKMREVEGGVAVPAGKEVTFKPGGLHLMLMELKAPLKKGQKFPVTLTFEKAGKKTVQIEVRKVGAMGPGEGHGHMGGMGGGGMGGHSH